MRNSCIRPWEWLKRHRGNRGFPPRRHSLASTSWLLSRPRHSTRQHKEHSIHTGTCSIQNGIISGWWCLNGPGYCLSWVEVEREWKQLHFGTGRTGGQNRRASSWWSMYASLARRSTSSSATQSTSRPSSSVLLLLALALIWQWQRFGRWVACIKAMLLAWSAYRHAALCIHTVQEPRQAMEGYPP